ncbi:hypothetical protein [Pedobacter rhodius]|uniref:VWFA domain-containing protein n=1 Tax=Pedobacter rhodius TaxID=3004098 RepID=A0ABT4L198_9SPHI|nr:hypothetical protein [Pedobacter sp. SJ11]MCZ4224959.1 hypothetical protein [Pedobacter sp. SJ11]
MNFKFKLLTFYIVVTLFAGCSENKKESNINATTNNQVNSKKENLNISILLDLSDRIDPIKNSNPSMEFYTRDLGYIESISKGFEAHLRAKPIRQDNDQIQIYFEPEPLNPAINNLAEKLKLSFTKDNTTKENILKISSQYISASSEIYKLAIKDKKYLGSDIWGFFKNKVNDYCIKPNRRNILFILTDGYMFHQDSKFKQGNKSSYITPEFIKSLKLNSPNYKELMQKKGYGFIKANGNLNNLEVFVLGINPAKKNPFERDVISEYWNNWLKEMNVKNNVIKLADLPSNLDQVIQKYINP